MNIEIRGLSKTFRKIDALADVNLTLSPGIHGLLGPNGAGKTTLMRILATILVADCGNISWGGARNWTSPKNIKGNIGFLPQAYSTYKYMKVHEVLRHVALLKDIPFEAEKKEVNLALERTNLVDHRQRRVGDLSGGMIRRLGIAQAILGEPSLLIMDEPSVGLDPTERINFRKLIRDYDNGKRIVIISSHIVNDIESLCNTVTIMNCGKVLITGSTVDIQAIGRRYIREAIVSTEEFKKLEKNHEIMNFTRFSGGYKVRYLTKDISEDTTAEATLEDSYTYIIRGNIQL